MQKDDKGLHEKLDFLRYLIERCPFAFELPRPVRLSDEARARIHRAFRAHESR